VDLGLDGRVVIVTGGASNLGRAITLGFTAEGARVVIADVDDKQAKKVEGEAPSGTITARHCDVTDWDSVTSTVQFVESTMGRVDVLVNCAGWTIDRLFMEKPRSDGARDRHRHLGVHQQRARRPRRHGQRNYGRIVSIGSDAGRMGSGERPSTAAPRRA
jgi:2-hydroxycyclohexanecarboxyl-CoA dehydrogenase